MVLLLACCIREFACKNRFAATRTFLAIEIAAEAECCL